MSERPVTPRWARHFVNRAECSRITWKLRLGVPALVVVSLWLTSGSWTEAIARSLVCAASAAPSDAILVENFEPDFLLYERAAQLRRAGLALRVLVPVWIDPGRSTPSDVTLEIVRTMARFAGLGSVEMLPIHELEPVTLNAARAVQRFLEREHLRSVIVVTPAFRSRRSALVYEATLGRAGVAVRIAPVQEREPGTWTRSWHGIQEVTEQWLKLQYYRLYVLPFCLRG